MKRAATIKAPALEGPLTLAALVAILRLTARRRPLWKPASVADFLDIDSGKVRSGIQDGRFPYVFHIGNGRRNSEPRILALSVLEERFGPDATMGATRKLTLPEVINLILPRRDLRSTELQRVLSCHADTIFTLRQQWQVTRPAKDKNGPYAFTVFSRASVADWLAKRRMT